MGTPGGSTSASTHDSVVSRSGSSPFDTLTTRAPPRSAGPARAMTSRTACDGADDTTTSAPRTASPKSPLARRVGPSTAPGRNIGFACSRLMPSTTSGSRAHRVTDSKPPLRASRSASAVPQAPPPITATLTEPSHPNRTRNAERGTRNGWAGFDTDKLIPRLETGHSVPRSAFRVPHWFSHRHSLPGPEPILRAVEEPPDVRPVRVHDQQREREARPKRVWRRRPGEPHPEWEQDRHRE